MVLRNRYRKTKRRGSGMTPRTPKTRRPSSLPRKRKTPSKTPRTSSNKKDIVARARRRSGISKLPEPIMSTPRSRFHSPRAGSTSKQMLFKPQTMSKTPIASRPSSISKKTSKKSPSIPFSRTSRRSSRSKTPTNARPRPPSRKRSPGNKGRLNTTRHKVSNYGGISDIPANDPRSVSGSSLSAQKELRDKRIRYRNSPGRVGNFGFYTPGSTK